MLWENDDKADSVAFRTNRLPTNELRRPDLLVHCVHSTHRALASLGFTGNFPINPAGTGVCVCGGGGSLSPYK